MNTYLDVGATRIQAYLARTANAAGLKGWRGASALITQAMSPDELGPVLDGRARLNPEAGQPDGKVSFILESGDPKSLAERILLHLRKRLPGLELQAAWGQGSTYLEAYAKHMEPMLQEGKAILALPAPYEFPLTRNCQACGLDSVVAERDFPERTMGLCEDCMARFEFAGPRYELGHTRSGKEFRASGLSSEFRLIQMLGERGVILEPVRDFAALARLGNRSTNHLATVYIDGNGVGRFFKEIISLGSPPTKLSLELEQATFEALAKAAAAVISDTHNLLPVVPHVVGGDDVLISLPAEMGWAFTLSYLQHFTKSVGEVVRQRVPGARSSPTASAALVFAHESYPFTRSVTLAGRMLRAAKAREGGRAATALWVDVTREGEAPPPHRSPWTLQELTATQETIRHVAALPKSLRAGLGVALDHPDESVALARTGRLARRHGLLDTLRPLALSRGANGLRDALEISLWWT